MIMYIHRNCVMHEKLDAGRETWVKKEKDGKKEEQKSKWERFR